jgi:hypothetical protein
MNTHKLFNGLIILTLLLPALLTGSPTPTRAAPPSPNTAAPAGILTWPHVSTSGVAPGAVNQYLRIEPLYKYGDLRGCTSVYTITNESSETATTRHDFYDEYNYVHGFDDLITAKASKAYDLADLVVLPDDYDYVGYALVGSDRPITYTLDPCPRQAWGTDELDPGASIAQTFNEEGVYPVTDPTTMDPADPAKRVSGEVQVGMGTTSLALSASSVTTVTVTEVGFTPQVVQVAVGDTVRWVNEGSQTHGVIGLERVWSLFLPLVVRNQ